MKPQEPRRPFPYLEKHVEFTNPKDATMLRGTLTFPRKEGRFPAVVLVSGSGPQDRDEEILGHKPFLVIADYLTRHDIVVLRYDDRHFKLPVKQGWRFTTHDLAGDAAAAVDFLKGSEAVDPGSIGLCGHSEGGLIAAMVASQGGDIAFVISLAGPGQPSSEITRYQALAFSKNQRAAEFALELQEVVRTEPSREKRLDRAKRLIRRHYRWYEFFQAWLARAYLPMTLSEWSHAFAQLQPRTYWEKTRCPVLALCGEYDRQVPAKENLEEIRAALVQGGNPDFDIQLIPNANHLFQTLSGNPGGDYRSLIREYGKNPETVSPTVLETVRRFILSRFPAQVPSGV